MMPSPRPAVFLDRDGTLNAEQSYITRPEQMQLLPGVGTALRRVQSAGFACVVVTNQSAIGRGLMTETDLERIHAEMIRQLEADGVVLDGIYHCPIVPLSQDPLAYEHPDRKPAPGMLLRAAAELDLDLPRSWMIGDGLRDMLAGHNAGCRGCILVRTGHPFDVTHLARVQHYHMADHLLAAVAHILAAC